MLRPMAPALPAEYHRMYIPSSGGQYQASGLRTQTRSLRPTPVIMES